MSLNANIKVSRYLMRVKYLTINYLNNKWNRLKSSKIPSASVPGK
jgi:hypothetical protein